MAHTVNAVISDKERQRYETYLDLITKDEQSDKIIYLGEMLKYAAQRYDDDIALIFQDRSISYKELYFHAQMLARKLKLRGVQPRDRVLLFFENSIEFYVAYFAILQCGAVVAPLNVFLQERELEHIIKDAQPSLIIASSTLAQLVEKIGIAKPPLITEEAIDLDAIVPDELPDDPIEVQNPKEMAVLLYTSGTTGFPKGVMLSSENALINAVQGMARIQFARQARVFCVLPLFHSFAQNTCVWTSLLRGCTVIVVPKIDRRYILHALKHKPDFFLGVPALYGLLCLMRTAPLEDVRYFISGGDALPDKVREAFALVYNRKICNGYGLTEASPLIAFEIYDCLEPTNAVGRPLINIEVVIRDDHGKEVPRGEIGKMWVKGPNIMMGYYNAPEKTKEVLRDGWLDTGDSAYINSYGSIIIAGRLKDLIIHKGFNIYPQEIENVILGHEAVVRTAVIGKKDDASGEVPIAFIQLRRDKKNIQKELKELCEKNLAGYKVPREFICTTTPLPVTSTGKVNKNRLRAEYSND